MLKYGDPGYMEEDRSHELYAITFSVLAVAIIVVFLRLFSRWYLVRARSWNLSEVLIIVSVVVDIASCILIHFQIQTGMGKHIEYSRERPAMLQMSMKVGLAQNVTYQALIGLIKTSILAQYHLLAPSGTPKKVVLWTTIFVVIWTLFTTFAAIFQCIPMNAAWNLATFPKGCWNMMEMNYFTSSMNTFLDIVIFAMPLRTIVGLQMDRKKKIALGVGFSVGLIATACSVVRLRNIAYFRGVGDFTYEAAMVPIWGAIECNSGIVCASFPFTVPLFRCIGGSVFRTLTGTRTDTVPGGTYELRQTKDKSWPMTSRRHSEWHQMPSESTEKIASEPISEITEEIHEEARKPQEHV